MADQSALDDAAAAALWALRNEPTEQIGLLYRMAGGVQATPTHTQRSGAQARGVFQIPSGALLGVFHNHPPRRGRRRDSMIGSDADRATFSRDDVEQAKRLGVPSYIAAGPKLRRYDPATGRTEDVLAMIPIDEIMRDLMIRLLNRDPNDPRGLYRDLPHDANLLGLLDE